MRFITLLLVLINLGLFAYFNQYLFGVQTTKPTLPEITPERIVLLSEAELKALPKRVASISPLQLDTLTETCYEWGIFTAANALAAETALKNLNVSFVIKQASSSEANRFWVYRLPLPSSEAAQKKVLELKALGIEDLFVVQEPKWKNAISFGVFSDEALATKLLNELQARGVRNVIKAQRNQGNNPISFKLSGLSSEALETVKILQPEYADTNLTEISCKP